MSTKDFGFSGEKYATSLLIKKGYKIIERNFRTKFGEIDIVAIQNNTLVFVEVKTRKSNKFGLPQEAVTPRKINKIKMMGLLYSRMHERLPSKMRIDVVALIVQGNIVTYEKLIKVM